MILEFQMWKWNRDDNCIWKAITRQFFPLSPGEPGGAGKWAGHQVDTTPVSLNNLSEIITTPRITHLVLATTAWWGCGLLLGESALGTGPLGGNGRSSETSVLAHDSSANMSIQSNVGIMGIASSWYCACKHTDRNENCWRIKKFQKNTRSDIKIQKYSSIQVSKTFQVWKF